MKNWESVTFETLEPLTNPFFEPIRKIYKEDWDRWVKEKGKDDVYILREGGELLGFYKTKETDTGIKICSLFISSKLPKAGIKIIKKIIKEAKEKKKIVYGTIWKENLKVRKYFEHIGFKPVPGIRKTKLGNISEIVYEYYPSDNEDVV